MPEKGTVGSLRTPSSEREAGEQALGCYVMSAGALERFRAELPTPRKGSGSRGAGSETGGGEWDFPGEEEGEGTKKQKRR